MDEWKEIGRLIYIKPADLIYISRPLFTICYNGYFRS